MGENKVFIFLLFVAILLAACSPQVSPVSTAAILTTNTSIVSKTVITGGTEPVPTPLPDSTMVPWWGTTLHTFDIDPKYLSKPTGIDVAQDGSIFVADSGNNRILHIDQQGIVLHHWGTTGKSENSQIAPSGTFNEPYGVAVSPDGFVFVADTWNHRIQKFSTDGTFVLSWGGWGNENDPFLFWGPRDVVIHPSGFVIVTDTGNKRVVVYDKDGKYINQIGGEGSQPGQFNEPVGLEIGPEGDLYVADQGNRRVQVLTVNNDGSLLPKSTWPVDGWATMTLEYKPFLCINNGKVFLTDPEPGSVLEYSLTGEYIKTYIFSSTGYLNYGFVYGIASDPSGGIWVSDYAGGGGVLVKMYPDI